MIYGETLTLGFQIGEEQKYCKFGVGKELEKVGNMERRRRTGGDGGDRGMEENTMALLDTSGFSNSKLSHHLNDDRAYIYIYA